MNSFRIFLAEYVGVLIFFVIFNSAGVLDSVIFIVFTLSAIFYVFAFQVLPTSKVIETPSVQYYRASKFNMHGLVMAIILVCTSLLFFVLNIVFELRTGIATIVVWPIMLLSIHFFTERSQKDLLEKIITDFMTKNLSDGKSLDVFGMVKFLIGKLNKQTFSESELTNILVNEYNLSKDTSEEFVVLFITYLDEVKDLNSDEIEYLNDESKNH